MSVVSSPRRVERVRHELKRREMQVVNIEQAGPHFRRILFRGPDLADFVSLSFDDHVKLFFPSPDGGEPARRDYTPRAYDNAAQELTIEFALHGEGPAAGWAERAEVGQRLTVGGPKGSMIIPLDHDWHLLAGDETAVPAVARRLEQLPPGTPAFVVLNVPDAADRREFETRADLALHWVDNEADLLAAVRALRLPSGDGYAWCAGEAAAMAALRQVIVGEKGHPREAIRASAYWKRGAIGHHENLEG